MTPQPNILQHDAHVLTALQTACAFGRAEYDAEQAIELSLKRALAAYRKFMGEVEINPEFQPVQTVIGGGNSLTGKIKWLLENRGSMTRLGLTAATGHEIESVTAIVAMLRTQKLVGVEGRGNDARFFLRKAVGV